MVRIRRRARPDDLTAHAATLIAVAFVQDAQGRVLVHRPPRSNVWTLPAGPRHAGESVGDAVHRTMTQGIGLDVEVQRLIGIYAEPAQPGESAQQHITVCMRAQPLNDDAIIGPDLRWVTREETTSLPVDDATRQRIGHGFENRRRPYIDARHRHLAARHRTLWPRRQT